VKRFFFFFPWVIFATVNEPFRCEILSGYRNDRLHWHLQDPGDGGALTYSELYRDLQFWENGLVLKTIQRDLVFYARGSYAAFGPGTLFQRYADLGFTDMQPHFQFDAHGFAADTSGYFGYAVNLTADRTYKVLLIPLVGVSAHFEQLLRNDCSPKELEEESFTMQSSLPGKLHQTWYGFFLGGAFQIEPGGRFVLQAGYTYHWLRCKFKTHFNNTFFNTKLHLSEGGNLGHTGWAQLDYLLSRLWRVGLGGQIHYFSSRVVDAHLVRQTDGGPENRFSEKFKLRWTSVAGFILVSREF